MGALPGMDTPAPSALLSDDGRYRFRLTRHLEAEDHPGPRILWVMLNPSTADATADDQTITKCLGFSSRLGASRLDVVNLYAYRATKPTELAPLTVTDRIGPGNDQYIATAAGQADVVICGWGAGPPKIKPATHENRERDVHRLLLQNARPGVAINALRVTAKGRPWHPCYLGYEHTPQPWTPPWAPAR